MGPQRQKEAISKILKIKGEGKSYSDWLSEVSMDFINSNLTTVFGEMDKLEKRTSDKPTNQNQQNQQNQNKQ